MRFVSHKRSLRFNPHPRPLPLRGGDLSLSLVAVFFLYSFLAAADLPSKPAGFVTDQARILDAATVTQLESLLIELKQKTSAEMAVVTVQSLNGQDIGSYAVQLFQKWGIGQKGKDNGVLFLVAPNDRKARIEVGYGLEGVLPDGYVGRVFDQVVMPSFRAGQMPEGVLAGANVVAHRIAETSGVTLNAQKSFHPPVPAERVSSGQAITGILFLLLLLILFMRHPWLFLLLMSGGGGGRGGWSGGGFGGGFGGFGGGMSGGGGASRSW